jgi:hypothetical protein
MGYGLLPPIFQIHDLILSSGNNCEYRRGGVLGKDVLNLNILLPSE